MYCFHTSSPARHPIFPKNTQNSHLSGEIHSKPTVNDTKTGVKMGFGSSIGGSIGEMGFCHRWHFWHPFRRGWHFIFPLQWPYDSTIKITAQTTNASPNIPKAYSKLHPASLWSALFCGSASIFSAVSTRVDGLECTVLRLLPRLPELGKVLSNVCL